MNANSAETVEPTVGADSVDSDMLASDAEPGQPIRDAGNAPDNRAID